MDNLENTTTRNRLLEAAGLIFAEQGFKNATVRDICTAAQANIAAVNYHFGDKVALYEAVVAYANDWAINKYPIPPAPEVCEGLSMEARLKLFIHRFLSRFLDPGRPSWHGQLMAREMADPTDVLDKLMASMVRPSFTEVFGVLRNLLNPTITDDRVRMVVFSVVGQCIFFHHAKPIHLRMGFLDYADPKLVEKLAAHIFEFTISAIAELNRTANAVTT
jgi:AcrR family transcriptional regulator